MPSFGPVSSAPISALGGGIVSAVASFVGSGSFSPLGASTATAALAVAGAGALHATGASTAKAALSAVGAGIFAPVGASTAQSAFAFAGQGVFNVHAVPRPSPERTVILPFTSRSLTITRGSRMVEPRAFDRSVSVQRLPRAITAAAA